jgi:hypothetical protein
MRFKRIAFFFIVFANTLVLVHSIIPHHHHKGLVVNLAAIKASHSYDKNFNDHSHENEDDADCALKQEILIPGRIIRSGGDSQIESSEQHFFNDLSSLTLISPETLYYPVGSSLNQVQYGLSKYLFLLNNSRGLRGPPVS